MMYLQIEGINVTDRPAERFDQPRLRPQGRGRLPGLSAVTSSHTGQDGHQRCHIRLFRRQAWFADDAVNRVPSWTGSKSIIRSDRLRHSVERGRARRDIGLIDRLLQFS
ncbi:hypothetical protein [Streptomyces coelicoflavus]|uniref:hypothetical protein n=1 Tax=Streptomyces coelicoflavus TaxID=285562 RepID=UPI0036967A1D